MMDNKNNLMGLQLQMDPEYIKSITRDIIKNTILNTFDEQREQFVKELVLQTLNQPVDKNGVFSDSRYGTKTLAKHLIDELVKEQTKEVLKEVLDENKGKLRETLKKHLSKNTVVFSFLEAFVEGVNKNLDNAWKTNIEVNITKEED